jgi:hypothetical protein
MKVRYSFNSITRTFSFFTLDILLAKRARRDSVDPVNPPVTSSSSITTSTTAPESNDIKKKRYIEDYSQFDEFTNDNSDEDVDDISIEHKLHPKIKETPGQIHDRTDSKFYYIILIEQLSEFV